MLTADCPRGGQRRLPWPRTLGAAPVRPVATHGDQQARRRPEGHQGRTSGLVQSPAEIAGYTSHSTGLHREGCVSLDFCLGKY